MTTIEHKSNEVDELDLPKRRASRRGGDPAVTRHRAVEVAIAKIATRSGAATGDEVDYLRRLTTNLIELHGLSRTPIPTSQDRLDGPGQEGGLELAVQDTRAMIRGVSLAVERATEEIKYAATKAGYCFTVLFIMQIITLLASLLIYYRLR